MDFVGDKVNRETLDTLCHLIFRFQLNLKFNDVLGHTVVAGEESYSALPEFCKCHSSVTLFIHERNAKNATVALFPDHAASHSYSYTHSNMGAALCNQPQR